MSNKKSLSAVDLLPENILMGGRSYAHKWQTLGLNMRSYQYWMYRLRCVAMSAFEWTGLDELGIDSRFVEYCMLNWGMGGFFELREGTGSYAFAQATPMSRLNLYWNPNKIKLMPANGSIGWTRHAWYWAERLGTPGAIVHKPNAIVLWDNIDRTPIYPLLESFARRLENIDRKIDININAQATPYIMDIDERQRQDAINLYQQITGNEPMIIANKNRAELLQPSVLNLEATFVADKMDDELTKIWYRALTMLGVDNTNTEKRERMIDAEATANNEDIMLMRRSRLATRRRFCEQVNERFGLDISVKYGVPHEREGSADVDMGGYDGNDTNGESDNLDDGGDYGDTTE